VFGGVLLATLAAVGCEPLDIGGGSGTAGGREGGTSRTATKTSHTVVYEVSQAGSTRRSSTRVTAGSTARVTARGTGGGVVSCTIVIDGRTVVRRSSSGSNAVVTCSARVSR
jgi:hypothetical protein